MSNLLNIVSKLSKSSAESVHTTSIDNSSIFNYLHTITPVEEAYIERLKKQENVKSLIFLCGSSGDGKSAIIAQNKSDFEKNYKFHLDATHSFKSNQTATEELDDRFTEYINGNRSLVVGINIGILMNYVLEGSSKHNLIKEDINTFLEKNINAKSTFFINFDDYSKFEFKDSKVSAPFIKTILEKITSESEENPFSKAFDIDIEIEKTSMIHQNFKLLSLPVIQDSIIELLIAINLKYDQFLTARSLLDLVYILLTTDKLLINQLFEDETTSMMKNLKKEDPLLNRSYQLDKFILDRSSNKEDMALKTFVKEFNALCKKEILNESDSSTLIRVFYLFRNQDVSNSYHQVFSDNFNRNDKLIYDFIQLVSIHHKYEDKDKKVVRSFYESIKQAILLYINKKDPALVKKNIVVISSKGSIQTAAPIEIKPSWSKIKDSKSIAFNSFPLFLKINGLDISEKSISLNLLSMINLINDGYRPNKHDRNTIVLFDELVQTITTRASQSDEIIFLSNKKMVHFKNDEDEIEVISNEN